MESSPLLRCFWFKAATCQSLGPGLVWSWALDSSLWRAGVDPSHRREQSVLGREGRRFGQVRGLCGQDQHPEVIRLSAHSADTPLGGRWAPPAEARPLGSHKGRIPRLG